MKNFWIVKGNPDINDLHGMLEPDLSCEWYDPSNQKKNGAQAGDGIFFWSSGKDRFVLGLGEMGNPLVRTEGRNYIFEVTYLTEALLTPVTLDELKTEPLFDPDNEFCPRFMIGGPIQTRYSLTEEEAKRLAEMILERNPDDETAIEVFEKWFPELQTIAEEEAPEPEESEPEAGEFPEGKKRYVAHVRYERNRELVEQAKQKHREVNKGKLPCSICGFDFEANYGSVGKDFAEVHHATSLSDYEKLQKQTTSLSDLVVVCANCHRMLHRRRPWLTIQELGKLVE